jgi:hypothetical protein
MRALAFVLGASLSAAACGGAAQPAPTTAPTGAATAAPTVAATAAPTPATKLTFTADLRSENEVPPVANEEKTASGKATLVFDLTRDAAGKITAAKMSVDATFSGLTPTSAITIAHIHGPAPAGQNAGVFVGFKTDAANPIAPAAAGTATFKVADVTVEPDKMQQIIDSPGNFYVNFHSRLNAGGVVRGQLVKG